MRLKLFLTSFLLSLAFWWSINLLGLELEDFFFWQNFSSNQQLLAAQANQEFLLIKLSNLRRAQKQKLPEIELSARAALLLQYSPEKSDRGEQKVLFKKNISKRLPIASLSKLMTALVALENYSLAYEIEISKEAVAQEESIGNFKAGEKFRVKDIIYSLLVESSNDAAFALSEALGKGGSEAEALLPPEEKFVALMNSRAKDIGLQNTYFANPTGLDPDNEQGEGNYSTAEDLAKLTIYLLEKLPFIWQVLSKPTIEVLWPNGRLHHLARSTNVLLGKIPGVVGGKTGYTDRALGCFILVLKSSGTDDYLINIILGSQNRFGEMEKLIKLTQENQN